jgi:hypothetical protein
LRPRRMGDGDKGARLPRSLRQTQSALVRRRAKEIDREPGCDYMPIFSRARTMARTSAPIREVKLLERSLRVSAMGQSNRSRK